MVGEDAVSVYTQLLMKFIDLLSKIGEEHRQNKNRKPVKIRHGSLSRSDFTKLMENGAEFKFVSVPTQDANAVEQCAKDLGGSFFRVDPKDTETDTTMFAVPKSQIDLMNIAIKRTISESLTNTSDKLMVREGKDSIAGEDIPLVSDILNRFDIPAMPFKNKNGEYTVIVPTEYDGQYQQAMDKVNEIKSKMKNVDVISFNQHGDLKEPEYLARELSKDEAAELSRKIKSQGLDIKISKYEDKLYAVYDRNISDNINNIIDGYNDELHESDGYLLTLNDNSITIDKQTLLVGENEDEYFLRVPNTHGVDHIKLKKSEAEEINDGRTLRVRLESKKYYPVFDRNGAFQKERVGNELYRFYDIKHKGINKDTKVVEYGDRINRIDLFNKDKNMLISVGIDNAEGIKAELMENGISERAAENLLKDIDELMKEKPEYEEYRSIFNYTAEKPEIVYADVPNIGDIIAQTQLSENIYKFDFGGNFYTLKAVIPMEIGWKKYDVHEEKISHADHRQGDRITVNSVSIKQCSTNQPERYTDSTLISVMNNIDNRISDTELKEAVKGKGIGTESTRAEIIEQLISAGYIRREGMSIVPTDFGRMFVESLPLNVRSVERTAEWEKRLEEIQNGADMNVFLDEVKDFVRSVIDYESAPTRVREPVTYGESRNVRERRTVGICPRCGKNVYEPVLP